MAAVFSQAFVRTVAADVIVTHTQNAHTTHERSKKRAVKCARAQKFSVTFENDMPALPVGTQWYADADANAIARQKQRQAKRVSDDLTRMAFAKRTRFIMWLMFGDAQVGTGQQLSRVLMVDYSDENW